MCQPHVPTPCAHPNPPAEYLEAHPQVDPAISPRCVLAEFTPAGPQLAFRVRAGGPCGGRCVVASQLRRCSVLLAEGASPLGRRQLSASVRCVRECAHCTTGISSTHCSRPTGPPACISCPPTHPLNQPPSPTSNPNLSNPQPPLLHRRCCTRVRPAGRPSSAPTCCGKQSALCGEAARVQNQARLPAGGCPRPAPLHLACLRIAARRHHLRGPASLPSDRMRSINGPSRA